MKPFVSDNEPDSLRGVSCSGLVSGTWYMKTEPGSLTANTPTTARHSVITMPQLSGFSTNTNEQVRGRSTLISLAASVSDTQHGIHGSVCVSVCVLYVYSSICMSLLSIFHTNPLFSHFLHLFPLSFSTLLKLWSLHSLSLANDCRGWQSTVSVRRHSQ